MDSDHKGSEELATEQVSDVLKDADQPPQGTIEKGLPAPIKNHGGPKSQQGKEKSKFNALKHGLYSNVILRSGESQSEFDSLLSGLRMEFEPEGTLEELLVEKLASLFWRYRRLIIIDKDQPRYDITNFGKDLLPPDLLLRYESNLDRSIERTLNQLERLQRMRKGEALPPVLNVNVSS